MNYKITEEVQRKEKIKNKKERKNEKNPPKKKALIVTTVSGFVPQFEMNNVYILRKLGYQVHYASNFRIPAYGEDNERLKGTGIICHQVDFERSPYKVLAAVKAYLQMKNLLGRYDFSLLHCHTPMGGAVARLAATARKRGKKVEKKMQDGEGEYACPVIYTAHGFHFFKGAPLLNWLFYYPAERLLAHMTDILVTVNREDYYRAKKFHLRKRRPFFEKTEKGEGESVKKQVFLINGVGIDLSKYRKVGELREAKRRELGLAADEFMMLSVGELTRGKNHRVVIRALAKLHGIEKRTKGKFSPLDSQDKWKYFIAGKGAECERLEKLIERNGLKGYVILLGYRTDIGALLAAADCFIFPSKREGMPVALMEALAAGVPCIAADIRGCRELLGKGELVRKNRVEDYCRIIYKLIHKSKLDTEWEQEENYSGDDEKRRKVPIPPRGIKKPEGMEELLGWISEENVKQQMEKIYRLI